MSGFTTNELLYPLTKGDTPGHPFRGNQYQAVGNISPEVAKFITDKANAFYKAGGTIEHLKPGATELSNGRSLYAEMDRLQNAPRGARADDGRDYIVSAIYSTLKSEYVVGTFIATDEDGNIVGALDYNKNGHIGMLGSTGDPQGIATALEVEMARQAVKDGTGVNSEATHDSETFHHSIGRTVTPDPSDLSKSEWTPEEAKAIASLPVGPKHL